MVKTSQNQSVKKKRNTRGMGSIRSKNGGYEGRITIKVNGKSKQISLFNKDKRILVQDGNFIDGSKYSFYKTFGLTTYTATDKLKVRILFKNKPYIVELEKAYS